MVSRYKDVPGSWPSKEKTTNEKICFHMTASILPSQNHSWRHADADHSMLITKPLATAQHSFPQQVNQLTLMMQANKAVLSVAPPL